MFYRFTQVLFPVLFIILSKKGEFVVVLSIVNRKFELIWFKIVTKFLGLIKLVFKLLFAKIGAKIGHIAVPLIYKKNIGSKVIDLFLKIKYEVSKTNWLLNPGFIFPIEVVKKYLYSCGMLVYKCE